MEIVDSDVPGMILIVHDENGISWKSYADESVPIEDRIDPELAGGVVDLRTGHEGEIHYGRAPA